MLLGDFNRDGALDLAVANGAGHLAALYLGNGQGAFTAVSGALTGSTGATSLAVGDLNGDGYLDLVSARRPASRSTTAATRSPRR